MSTARWMTAAAAAGVLCAALAAQSPDALALKRDAAGRLRDDRPAEALVLLDRAASLAPRDAEIAAYRADALFRLERTGEALAAFDAAIALDASLAPHLYNRGAALLKLRRVADAQAHFTVMRDHGTTPAEKARGAFGLGACLADAGDDAGARRLYAEALAADATFLRARYQLALCLMKGAEHAEAVRHLLVVAESDPLYEGAAYNLALAYGAQNLPKETAEWQEKFRTFRRLRTVIDTARLQLRTDARSASALRSLADAYAEAGALRDAAGTYARLRQVVPADRDVTVAAARVAVRMKDFPAARACYEDAVAAPDCPAAIVAEYCALLDQLGATTRAGALRARPKG